MWSHSYTLPSIVKVSTRRVVLTQVTLCKLLLSERKNIFFFLFCNQYRDNGVRPCPEWPPLLQVWSSVDGDAVRYQWIRFGSNSSGNTCSISIVLTVDPSLPRAWRPIRRAANVIASSRGCIAAAEVESTSEQLLDLSRSPTSGWHRIRLKNSWSYTFTMQIWGRLLRIHQTNANDQHSTSNATLSHY